jgi:hypothetical protein
MELVQELHDRIVNKANAAIKDHLPVAETDKK